MIYMFTPVESRAFVSLGMTVEDWNDWGDSG